MSNVYLNVGNIDYVQITSSEVLYAFAYHLKYEGYDIVKSRVDNKMVFYDRSNNNIIGYIQED